MRPFVAGLIFIAFNSAIAQGADRLDVLFASWQEAQLSTQSLVVEFTQETHDLVYQDRKKHMGSMRLLRTQKGDLLASYETTEVNPKGITDRYSALLHGETIYLLNHDRKLAYRIHPAGGDLQMFLEKFWHPVALLLNRQRAEEQCKLSILKQDDSYTHLDMKPKKAKELKRGQLVGNAEAFLQARVVLTNKASKEIPKDMPCEMWYRNAFHSDLTFKISSWRLNPRDAPKPQEFTKPEDRPGWEVVTFLSLGKK